MNPITTPHTFEALPSVQVEEPGFGRSILTWLAIAVISVMTLVTGGMLLSGAELVDAVGLGLFATMWGGTGFGVMLGGVVHANRLEQEARVPRDPVTVAVPAVA